MRIFSGIYKGRAIQTPAGSHVRPTSAKLRQSLFNICQFIEKPYLFLDLFCGSGAMGLEALSRGASHATFVDSSRESIRCIKQNVNAFGCGQTDGITVDIIHGDVFDMLEKLAKKRQLFDIIYADPPYHMGLGLRTLLLIDELNLLKPSGYFFLEEENNSLPEDVSLKNLVLKNSRQMGKSTLWQFMPIRNF